MCKTTNRVARAEVSKRKNSAGEWTVKAYDANGARLPECDYYTNDKTDAQETALQMVQPVQVANTSKTSYPCAIGHDDLLLGHDDLQDYLSAFGAVVESHKVRGTTRLTVTAGLASVTARVTEHRAENRWLFLARNAAGIPIGCSDMSEATRYAFGPR